MEKLKQLIGDHLGLEYHKILDTDRLVADLGTDSLDSVELFIAIEEEFGIEMDEGDFMDATTIADIHAMIERVQNGER